MRKPLIEWCKTTGCTNLKRIMVGKRNAWICMVTGKRPNGVGDCPVEKL